MESNLQTLIKSGQEDNDELRTRVYVDTMDPVSHNKVRGYGRGVTPDMQPPMPYMQQLPYQVLVYRPEMTSPSGFCPGIPAGEVSGMLTGVGFDVDLTRVFGSQGGSQGREGFGSHSGSGPVE
ncbi:pinin-like [Pyrus ussuriensis x Pyrus communis]|uniref:Pinin-like n=1 Tax=Pyrus ussuriensis x Pyrus communis TaxID=2448454 RepID=A0A5N5H684_9ROSA|nr:pinin-like [Pyrus ussuriensis x Pyrus communis]